MDSKLAFKRREVPKQHPFLHARTEKIVSCYPIPRFNLFTVDGAQLFDEKEIIGTYGVFPNSKNECELYLRDDPIKGSAPAVHRQKLRLTIVTPEQEKIFVTVHPEEPISRIRELIAAEVKNDPKLTKSLTGT